MGFTGIVEEMGTVKTVEKQAKMKTWDGKEAPGFVIEVACAVALEGAYIGCSIAVDGICLTATELNKNSFKVRCCGETSSTEPNTRVDSFSSSNSASDNLLLAPTVCDLVERWIMIVGDR